MLVIEITLKLLGIGNIACRYIINISYINSLRRSIATVCIIPYAGRKTLQRKHESDPKNTGIRKGETVTIVKEKVIVPQQFFLQN